MTSARCRRSLTVITITITSASHRTRVPARLARTCSSAARASLIPGHATALRIEGLGNDVISLVGISHDIPADPFTFVDFQIPQSGRPLSSLLISFSSASQSFSLSIKLAAWRLDLGFGGNALRLGRFASMFHGADVLGLPNQCPNLPNVRAFSPFGRFSLDGNLNTVGGIICVGQNCTSQRSYC